MKIETLVLAFFLQTLLFSVEIRGRGQISNQTGVIAHRVECLQLDIINYS